MNVVLSAPAAPPAPHVPVVERESYRAECPPLPRVMSCGLLLVGIKLSLALVGFSRTRRWVEAMSRAPVAHPPVTMDRVEELERTVALAAAFYPGRALCLEQSLTLHAVLRREGAPSRLRLGAQRHPFAAHAWIEVDGVPVNDVAEHVRHFTPFPEAPV